MPIGQASRNIDEIMGTNTQDIYDGLGNYVARGNYISPNGQAGDPRRLPKIPPNEAYQPAFDGGMPQQK